MEHLESRTIDVSRGYTYQYYFSPARDKYPTVLLIHGFPDSPDEFSSVTRDYLVPHGYGVVVLTCLGYSGSSKPHNPAAYNLQSLAKDITEILDKESLGKVVSLGHDWGAPIAQFLYNFHPDRVLALVMLSVAYMPPKPEPFSLDAVIDQTTQLFGYGVYWYWHFFVSEEASQLMEERIESFFTLTHGEPEIWRETLCEPDGVKNYLLEDKRLPVQDYANEEFKKRWIDRFKSDEFTTALNYYRSLTWGLQDDAFKTVLPENRKVNVPYLFFGGQRDYVCRPELLQISIDASLIPDCTKVVVDAGHWGHEGLPEIFGQTLLGWLKEKI